MPIVKYHTTVYIDTPKEFQNDLSYDGWARSEDHTCISSDQLPDLIEETADKEELNSFLKDVLDTIATFSGDIVFSYYSTEK